MLMYDMQHKNDPLYSFQLVENFDLLEALFWVVGSVFGGFFSGTGVFGATQHVLIGHNVLQ